MVWDQSTIHNPAISMLNSQIDDYNRSIEVIVKEKTKLEIDLDKLRRLVVCLTESRDKLLNQGRYWY